MLLRVSCYWDHWLLLLYWVERECLQCTYTVLFVVLYFIFSPFHFFSFYLFSSNQIACCKASLIFLLFTISPLFQLFLIFPLSPLFSLFYLLSTHSTRSVQASAERDRREGVIIDRMARIVRGASSSRINTDRNHSGKYYINFSERILYRRVITVSSVFLHYRLWCYNLPKY